MRYLKVQWLHDFEDEPVLIFSEIDGSRETRKIEIYRSGKAGIASAHMSTRGALLAIGSFPTIQEIAKQDEFRVEEIDQETFDIEWTNASS